MRKFTLSILFALFATVTAQAAVVTLNFSSTENVVFNGNGTFTFPTDAVTGNNILIVSGGSGSAVGLEGAITGTFAIGPVATVGPLQAALVGGKGKLTIDDGVGNDLTADLVWYNMYTIGPFGGLNAGATVNLTNFSYAGANADLVDLASAPAGIVTTTFQFTSATSLTFLKNNKTSTSYSGSITAVPEPLFSGLALVGAIGTLIAVRYRRRQDEAVAEDAA